MNKLCVLIIMLFALSFDLQAEPLPSSIGPIYYKIGGGRVGGRPLTGYRTIRIDASYSASFGYSCGKFNPHETVSRMINQIKEQVRQLPQQLETAFTSALVSLPGYLFKREYPGLYGIITKTLDDSFNLFEVSMKSCKQIEREMSTMGKDHNPYQNLMRASVAEKWEFEAGVGSGLTIDQIDQEVNEEAGRDGVRWLDGVKYAGLDQDPIRFNRDLTIAGYNTLIGRSPEHSSSSDISAPDAPFSDHYLVDVWATPLEAANFLVEIVGETELKTAEGEDTVTKPGMGIRPFVQSMTESIDAALWRVVNLNEWEDIRALDSLGVSGAIVESIRKQDVYVRNMMVAKMAGEMAVAETQERVQLIRQLLNAGLKDANLTASKAASIASTHVRKEVFKDLEAQIEEMIKAYEFRTAFLNRTSMTILQNDAMETIRGVGKEAPKSINTSTIRSTAVPSD